MKKRIFVFLGIFVLLIVVVVSSYFLINNEIEKVKIGESLIGDTNLSAEKYHLHKTFDIEKIVSGNFITGMAFSPDGTLYFSDMGGKISKINEVEIIEFGRVPNAYIPIEEEGEAGVYSIAIDPDFEENKFVYAYYLSDGTGKIGRYEEINGKGENFEIIFDGIVQGKIHNGGDLEFGKDGKLYLSTGDATKIKTYLGENNPAQDINDKRGKVLRINKDGSIPDDNPYPNSYTYAYGFRNIFGFAIDNDGGIFVGEQGRSCCEEVDYIKPGMNYGWPYQMGFFEENEYENPVFAWDKKGRVSPTGMTFYYGENEEFDGNLFMGTWRTREIYRFIIEDNRIVEAQAYEVEDLYDLRPTITGRHAGEIHEGQVTDTGSAVLSQGLLDMIQGPDGILYFSDARGIFKLDFK